MAARWLEGSRLSNQVSGGVPQGEGPGSLKRQGRWQSKIRNEAVPPRIANAAYSRSGYAVGQQPAGLRVTARAPGTIQASRVARSHQLIGIASL